MKGKQAWMINSALGTSVISMIIYLSMINVMLESMSVYLQYRHLISKCYKVRSKFWRSVQSSRCCCVLGCSADRRPTKSCPSPTRRRRPPLLTQYPTSSLTAGTSFPFARSHLSCSGPLDSSSSKHFASTQPPTDAATNSIDSRELVFFLQQESWSD